MYYRPQYSIYTKSYVFVLEQSLILHPLLQVPDSSLVVSYEKIVKRKGSWEGGKPSSPLS